MVHSGSKNSDSDSVERSCSEELALDPLLINGAPIVIKLFGSNGAATLREICR